MTAEQLFSILNLMNLAAWLPLVFLPRARWATTIVPVAMPALFAVVYVVLVVSHFHGARADSFHWPK